MNKDRLMSLVLLALGGILTALTIIYTQVGIFEWLSLIPAAYVIIKKASDRSVKLRAMYGYGIFFFMCFYLLLFRFFFCLYPLDFLGVSKLGAVGIVIAAWLGLSFLQSAVFALLFVLLAVIARSQTVQRFRLFLPFAAAALWTFFEWEQTLGWMGVPWGRLAIGQTAMPFMFQSVSLFGSYFLTFLIVAVNFLLAYVIIFADMQKLCALISAGLFLLNAVLGTVLYFAYSDNDEKVSVGAVQGNISSGDKWMLDSEELFRIYCEHTKELAEAGAQLVVWPETALPCTFFRHTDMVCKIKQIAKEYGITILIGTFTDDKNSKLQLNSIVMVNPDGTIPAVTYSKRHLVPFGEYLPWRTFFEAVIPAIPELYLIEGDLKPGEDSNLFYSDVGTIGSIICFDSIYEELMRDSTNDGAELIAISTNDSWFSDSAACRMHNDQAKLRAVENGRYVIRAANTGISSIITPRGEEVCRLDPLVEGTVMGDVGMRDGKTLYSAAGNVVVWLSVAFLVGLISYDVTQKIICRHKSRKKTNE